MRKVLTTENIELQGVLTYKEHHRWCFESHLCDSSTYHWVPLEAVATRLEILYASPQQVKGKIMYLPQLIC